MNVIACVLMDLLGPGGAGGQDAGRSVPSRAGGRVCACGHPRQAHQHYRRGTDCAMCSCQRYRRPVRLPFSRLWRELRRD